MKLIDKLKEYFNKEEEVEIVPEESMYEKIIKENYRTFACGCHACAHGGVVVYDKRGRRI